MMDLCMAGIILVSCFLMKLFIDWCGSQVEPDGKK